MNFAQFSSCLVICRMLALGGFLHGLAGCVVTDEPNNKNDTSTCAPVDDNDPCTVDLCAEGIPVHRSAAADTPCADDGISCTRDVCNAAGACVHLALEDGMGCESGKVCFDGLCWEGCVIDGMLHVSGAQRADNNCQVCNPATSTDSWSNLDNIACEDDDSCTRKDTCKAGVCLGSPKCPNATCAAGICKAPTAPACTGKLELPGPPMLQMVADSAVAAADLDGDGKTDFAITNPATNTVSIHASNGNGTFTHKGDYGIGNGVASVAAADLNGDGRPDLVVANKLANGTVNMLLNQGNGSFAPRIEFPASPDPETIDIVEMNGDGQLDVVLTNHSLGTVSVLLNQGNGTLGPAAVFLANPGPEWSIADFNGDGKSDILTTNTTANTLTVLLNNGNGTLAPKTEYAVAQDPRMTMVMDVNGDGKPDIVVATGGAQDGAVSVLLNKGNGTFGNAVPYPAGEYVHTLAGADLYGDGKPEILAETTNGLLALINDGNGTFSAMDGLYGGGAPAALMAADFNGDGWSDIAFGALESTTMVVLRNNGDGTFSGTDYQAKMGKLVLVDINGDGQQDLAAVSDAVDVIVNRGDGTFTPQMDVVTGSKPGFIAAADIDDDGISDLVVLRKEATSMLIFHGNGDGTFANMINYYIFTTDTSVVVEDLNGDKHPDIAIAGLRMTGNSFLKVMINPGNGEIELPAPSVSDLPGSGTADIAAAAVDADYIKDLVVVNEQSNTVSVFLNLGNATFNNRVDYDTGLAPNSVALEDFNGDSKPDIAVANRGSNSVSILFNNGNGTFGSKTDYPTGNEPRSLVAADLDQDGKPDLVVLSSASGTDMVTILRNQGGGTFPTFVNYPAGEDPQVVIAGDMNADGAPDLVVTNRASHSVSVFWNLGGGMFGPRDDYSAAVSPTGVAIADMNLDGRMDLAVANSLGTTVSIQLNACIP